ncbi:MAG: DUF2249 domain-containing protein [Verrucomicrobiota bacterium]
MSKHTITLDVREDIRAGREPFSTIMAAVARLKASESLLLIAPFEPKPLFQVLMKQGFRHDSQQTATGDWQVLFARTEGTTATTDSTPGTASGSRAPAPPPTAVIDLDARGLEPPQPLVTILEAIAELPLGALLRARTDRRPMHLYAQLEDRGFTGESQEQPDGSFLTHIRHR